MPPHVEPDALRAALAGFPTGVTVVTAIGPAGPAGATANAVASLSLEPPMMLACLDLGSRTLVAVEHARLFGINVLAADQAELARRFSTKDPHPQKWDGVEWTERAGTPMIDGALIWLACELRDVHQGGDHMIATGPVVELEAAADGDPLIFHEGEYRALHQAG
jgi:3-hydroxy-9,10-secoandrosta-1,3,5(10)-triene-9,17-dione monooxygenase reductase component